MTEGAPHEYKETSGACADCGNSPVNHFGHYISNTLAVWSSGAVANGGSVHSFAVRLSGSLFNAIEQLLLSSIAEMPFSSFSRDASKACTYRSQVIWEEAQRRGIEMEQLFIFGRGTEIYRARIAGMWRYFQSLPVPPEKLGKGADWADDKLLLKRALSSASVATPKSSSVRTLREALEAVRALGGAAVVKPRSGSRGRHTTVNVRSQEGIEHAFKSAQKLCRYVLVEQYLQGPVCRATVVDGTLVGFFRAHAPRVIGNGTATIRELIEQHNRERHERVQSIVLTDEHRGFLARLGHDEQAVPGDGEIVPLTHRTGRLFGGTTRELLGAEHPKLREYLERAAGVLGIGVVGFDLIIPDPEKDPDAQEWGIIEANTLPYIDLHYLALEGKPSNVAAHIWDLWGDAVHSGGVDGADTRITIHA